MVKQTENLRIYKNSFFLYIRMLLLIVVQLYTVPIILEALGITDYGIYNVVGGVVTMFSFIGGSMASGSQRFIAFAIGKGEQQNLKKVFNSTLSIYILFALCALVLIECVGVWFLNTHMIIPEDRIIAANWVFQFSLLAFLINLISIPYNSAVIAHERMSVFAYVSIFECFLKLGIALLLPFLGTDKLIIYSILICVVAILVRIIYQVYCLKNFKECRQFCFCYDKKLGKELLMYSGWNMVGSVALIARQQGVNIVLNLFFGTILNAAHSIAQQVNGVLSQFVNNIYVATRPQITKLYAIGKKDNMWNLVFTSSKLAFFLLIYLCIPILVELPTILRVWLKKVPDYTVEISFLMILSILIETLANQIIGAFQAANNIKKYQIYGSSIILLNLPLSYFLLRIYSDNPLLPYIVSVLLSVLYVIALLWIASQEIELNLRSFLKEVLIKSVVVFIVSILIVWCFVELFQATIFRCFITIIFSSSVISLCIWLFGLDSNEKKYIKNILIKKIKNKK